MNPDVSPVPASFFEHGLGNVEGSDSQGVVEVFHEATKYWPSTVLDTMPPIADFLNDPVYMERSARGFNRDPLARRLPLADGLALNIDGGALLRQRSSERAFARTPVSLETLGSLLHHALRTNRVVPVTRQGADAVFHHRPYPSGGGLYPVEHYIVPLNVVELGACVAHYEARAHELEIVREQLPRAEFLAAMSTLQGVENAALAIVSTAVSQRSVAKYGPRGYRFALIEAGCASQNLCLAAIGHGLSSLLWGGYFDNRLGQLCGVDNVNESVVSVLFIGVPGKDKNHDRNSVSG